MKKTIFGVFVFLFLVVAGAGCVSNPKHREFLVEGCTWDRGNCVAAIALLEGVLTATPGPTATPTATPTPTPSGTPTATPATGQNLVVNGSFEEPEISSRSIRVGSGDLPGWQVAGSVDIVKGLWQPAEGSQSLDLTGTSRGQIFQQIPTEPGEDYLFEFRMSTNPVASSSRTFQVWGGGNLLETISISPAGRTTSAMNWESRQFTVRAVSSQTQIGFASLDDGLQGAALDSVSFWRKGTVTTTVDGAEIRQEVNLLRVRIPLRSTSTANNAPKGHADFLAERRAGEPQRRKLTIEVENLVLSANTRIEISVNGAGVVDSFSFGGGPRFELELDTNNGRTVPVIDGGEQMCVAVQGNPCLVAGTFPASPQFPPLP